MGVTDGESRNLSDLIKTKNNMIVMISRED